MSRQKLRIAVPVVAVVALVAGVASGLTAVRAHQAPAMRLGSYSVSAALRGTGKGTFAGSLSTSGSRGTLTWKLSLTPAGAAGTVQIRAAAGKGKLISTLCSPCARGAHGTRTISGGNLTQVLAGKTGVYVRLLRGSLRGTLTAHAKGSGGGLVIPTTPALVAKGKSLANAKGCQGCHSIDGTKEAGPTWKGLAGSKVHQTDGTTITATDSYIVSVIEDPTKLKVVGYDPSLMASYIPPGSISHADAVAITAYIKTLK